MPALLSSLAALFVGPLVARLAGPKRGLRELLDGYVVVAVGGLVVLHLLPEAIGDAGIWAIAAAGIGLLVPLWFERRLTGARHDAAFRWILTIALSGLAVHAMLDGAALAGADAHGDDRLALGIVLHRLPLGLLIWTAVRPRRGAGVALGLVGIVAVATLLGFAFGQATLSALPTAGFAMFQAFIAGSLLHVAVHEAGPRGATEERAPSSAVGHLPGALGALAAIATLIEMTAHSGESPGPGLDASATFAALALRCAPLLLLALAGAVLLRAGAPRAVPPCGCAVAPEYARRHLAGGSPRAGLFFLTSAPALGLDALLVTVALLGTELAVARLAAAVAAAAVVAWLLGSSASRLAPTRDALAPPADADLLAVVNHTLPWMAVGLAVAALLEPMIAGSWLVSAGAGVTIPVLALLGAPVYLCAVGVAPLAAVLLEHGLAPGAAVAFLVTAPALHGATWRTLRRLHGVRVAVLFVALMLALAVASGFLGQATLPAAGPPISLAAAAGEATGWQLASAAVLAALLLAALLRSGPRGLIDQIRSGGLPPLPRPSEATS